MAETFPYVETPVWWVYVLMGLFMASIFAFLGGMYWLTDPNHPDRLEKFHQRWLK